MSNSDHQNSGRDVSSIATLAVQLLSAGSPSTHDAREIANAVALATRIMEEASKLPKVRAYELFQRGAGLGIGEIAEIFAEKGWDKLKSYNSVADRVRDLLETMHQDIQVRSALVTASFRQRFSRIDPEETEREARAGIKSLLRKLGMNTFIDHRLEDVANRFWVDLIEVWLLGERQMNDELAKSAVASPALFSSICLDSSYENYTRWRRPPDGLAADGLFGVILWINTHLRHQIAEAGKQKDAMDKLFKLNLWPEFLCPEDRRYSKPFAECIASVNAGPTTEDSLLEKFDLGIQRFSWILARFMLSEFSAQFSTEPLCRSFDRITTSWNQLEPGEKMNLSEGFVADPPQIIECISSFLRGEVPFFPARFPFHGVGMKFLILRPYAQNLDRLLHSLGEASQLAHRLAVSDGFIEFQAAVRAEQTRILQMAEELGDAESQATQQKISEGEKLMKPLEKKFDLGKINAHSLFRYASTRGLLNDLLIR